MSLDDTLAAIDVVTTACAQCNRPCGTSPSDDFCSEACQRRWMQAGSVALPGITSNRRDGTACRVEITVDVSRFAAAQVRLQAALRRMQWARAAASRNDDPRPLIPGSMA